MKRNIMTGAIIALMLAGSMNVGAAAPSGAVIEDGVLRYYNSTGKAVVSCVYAIGEAKTNGVCKPGVYEVDENGALVALNGWRRDADGEVRVYEDGIPVYAGLVFGDDGHLYYVNSSCRAVRGRAYFCSKDNGLGFGELEFDSTGRAYVCPTGDGYAMYIVKDDGAAGFFVAREVMR